MSRAIEMLMGMPTMRCFVRFCWDNGEILTVHNVPELGKDVTVFLCKHHAEKYKMLVDDDAQMVDLTND